MNKQTQAREIKLYMVISHDRHRDDDFTLFTEKIDAVEYAKNEFKELTKHAKFSAEEIKDYEELIETGNVARYIDGDYGVDIVEVLSPSK